MPVLEPRIMPASYASFFMFMLVHMHGLSFMVIYASFRRLCSRYGDISIFLTAYLYCFRLFCAQCMCSSTRVWFSSLIIPDVWYLTTVSINNSTVYTIIHSLYILCSHFHNSQYNFETINDSSYYYAAAVQTPPKRCTSSTFPALCCASEERPRQCGR